MPRAILSISAPLLILAFAGSASAGIDPLSGIDFVHVGAPGNAPWMGNGSVGDQAVGHGSVAYEYNIGRFEVTTAQWAEFMNAVFDRAAGDQIPFVLSPGPWGAVATTPNNAGGFRWTVPAGQEMYPVGGVTWRTCAIYCNWLCNGKSTDRSAFMNGAYDVSTFGNMATGFTDQITHNASAQYWIPTWDEYIKASHYDPNRYGPSQPGYWVWNNTLGRAAIAGPPGTGEANFGFTTPNPLTIPLGSYPSIQSPWGLLDVAGGTTEWTELTFYSGSNPVNRAVEGSFWGSPANAGIADSIYTGYEGIPPGYHGYEVGFRIASSVPAPGTCIAFAGVFTIFGGCTRRRGAADATVDTDALHPRRRALRCYSSAG
jgi:formylglycine-generating enzyme required for sulfatase activity